MNGIAGSSLTEASLSGPARESVGSGFSAVSHRISMLRFILICGIVFIHVPQPDGYAVSGDHWFVLTRAFFTDGIFRATVPMLSAISGYLLFTAGLDRRLVDLFRKKSRTLLVPLVFWNLPLMFGLYLVERWHLGPHAFAVPAYPFDLWNWLNATLSITYQPANFPLFFLRDLFVISLSAPLIGLMIRRFPWLGLLLVGAVFWFDLDGNLVLRNTMVIDFYFGGLAAVYKWPVLKGDAYWPAILVVFLACSALATAFGPEDLRWFRVLAPWLTWPLASALAASSLGSRLASLAKYSFAVFVIHAPVLVALGVVFERFAAQRFYPLFWLAAPAFAIVAAIATRRLLYAVAPPVARIAFGSR